MSNKDQRENFQSNPLYRVKLAGLALDQTFGSDSMQRAVRAALAGHDFIDEHPAAGAGGLTALACRVFGRRLHRRLVFAVRLLAPAPPAALPESLLIACCRRAFEEALAEDLERTRRTGRPGELAWVAVNQALEGVASARLSRVANAGAVSGARMHQAKLPRLMAQLDESVPDIARRAGVRLHDKAAHQSAWDRGPKAMDAIRAEADVAVRVQMRHG